MLSWASVRCREAARQVAADVNPATSGAAAREAAADLEAVVALLHRIGGPGPPPGRRWGSARRAGR